LERERNREEKRPWIYGLGEREVELVKGGGEEQI
jgi:hypothetical protein